MTKRRLLCLTAVAGGSLLVAGLAGGGRHGPPATDPAAESAAASGEPARRFVVAFGHVDVEGGVIGLNPTQPGRVVDVVVRENEEVAKGRVLLRLDDTLARQRLREAEAVLADSQKQLEAARKLPAQQEEKLAQQQAAVEAARHRLSAAIQIRDHKKALGDKQLIGALEVGAVVEEVKALEAAVRAEEHKLRELRLNDARTAVERAEKDLEAKTARRDQAEYLLQECAVRAPAKGRVLRVLAGVGDLLTLPSRQPAIQFCPDGPRLIRAEIDQENAGRVGDPADGPIDVAIEDDSRAGGTWKGRLVRLSDWYTQRRSILLDPLQFNDVRTLECLIEVVSGDRPLRVGQRVRVMIQARDQ